MQATKQSVAPSPRESETVHRFLVDAEEPLWVADYEHPGIFEQRWTVFSPEGSMLGHVDTPPGFRVDDIGSDYVLGRWQDELNVEEIHLCRLIED